jgi:hypothetical protein
MRASLAVHRTCPPRLAGAPVQSVAWPPAPVIDRDQGRDVPGLKAAFCHQVDRAPGKAGISIGIKAVAADPGRSAQVSPGACPRPAVNRNGSVVAITASRQVLAI